MDNSTRSQYLQAMGIKQWTPRKPLPGAKALSEFTPVESSAVVPEEALLETEKATAISESMGHGTIEPSAPADPNTYSDTNAQVVEQNILEAEKTDIEIDDVVDISSQIPPQFRLQSWLFAGQCLVINDVANEGEAGQQSESLRLLRNILFALDFATVDAPVARTFSWPLLRNSHIDQSKTVAIDALQAFISKQLEGQSVKFILLMGKHAREFALPNLGANSVTAELNGYQTVMTKSVEDILMAPAKKRQVWSDLQYLRL